MTIKVLVVKPDGTQYVEERQVPDCWPKAEEDK